MEEAVLYKLIAEAREENQLAREQLIQAYRGQIAALASSICGRPLDWDNDDELSIGLIAFNEAINNFETGKGNSFWSYAKMIIHRRLVDYFRREARWKQRTLFPTEEQLVKHDAQEAWEQYRRQETAWEQAELVAGYQKALADFKISLDSLVKASPKHRDTKQNLMQIALVIKESPQLLNKLMETKQLPIRELMALTGQSRKVLEKGRKYIIALVLILTREEFAPIRDFVKFPGQEGR